MQVGALVQFRRVQRYHSDGQHLRDEEMTTGIIVEQFPPPDEVLFVMMGPRCIDGKMIWNNDMVVTEEDVRVI